MNEASIFATNQSGALSKETAPFKSLDNFVTVTKIN